MDDDVIQLEHGGGGAMSRDLIRDEIGARFGAGPLAGFPDGARLDMAGSRIAFTTDSYVVQPIEFPGGNIGDLAVHGTVNDLAVCAARPRWLSVGLILEEGLSRALLGRVLDALQRAAEACGVTVATGDTKVVARGQCDGLYVNTAGVGDLLPGFDPDPARIRAGDAVLVSGTIGDHGMAVMTAREGIDISGAPQSDTGPVHRLVEAMQPWAQACRFMRDPTRGGVAAVLNELVEQRPYGAVLDEAALPRAPGTAAAAEMLGIDLLNVACEGRLLAVCAREGADDVLEAWKQLPEGRHAVRIGEVSPDAGRIVLATVIGGRRLVDVPRGELLPRIC